MNDAEPAQTRSVADLDIVACGELLIDLVGEPGVSLARSRFFERAAGGAPANVAVGVQRLGRTAGFLGQVGDDNFGRFLVTTLRDEGVDVSQLRLTAEARTALAFVSLDADGERDFLFYRQPSADMLWRATVEDQRYAARATILHIGSISLIAEPSRGATLAVVDAARRGGTLIAYDPNLRLPLWPSREAAQEGVLHGLRLADIVKLSLDELTFLTGQAGDALESAARRIWHDGLRLLVVTRGAAGCAWFTASADGELPAFPVGAIDTTGAGDAFVAGLLTGLIETGLSWDPGALEHALRLASAAGALSCTGRGAIPSLPDRPAVERLLAQHPPARRASR